jgi:hypothetical protein
MNMSLTTSRRLVLVALAAILALTGVVFPAAAPSASAATVTPVAYSFTSSVHIRHDVSTAGVKLEFQHPVVLTDLGRVWLSGNDSEPTVQLIRVSDKAIIAEASVNLAAGMPDAQGFKWTTLSTPVIVPTGTYYLVSFENGSDDWYQGESVVYTASMGLTARGMVYRNSSGGWTEQSGTTGAHHFPALKIQQMTPASGQFYVDNRPGSNCSNAGAGTSVASPWCDFIPAISRKFTSGSTINLARGAVFTSPLYLQASGSSWNSPVTVQPYGSGAAPVIAGTAGTGQASQRGIYIYDSDYVSIRDLEITNVGLGIVAYYATRGHQGLRITDVYAHDIGGIFHGAPRFPDAPWVWNSTAVEITGPDSPQGATDWLVRDITLDGLVTRDSGVTNITNPTGPGIFPPNAPLNVRDVVIKNGDFADIPTPAVTIAGATNVRVFDNTFECSGHIDENWGTTCFYLWNTDAVAVHNNIGRNMNPTGNNDESWLDVEGANANVSIRGNTIYDNAGNGVELLQFWSTAIENAQIDDNVWYGNGYSTGSNHPADASIWSENSWPNSTTTATSRNNLYAEGTFVAFTGNNPGGRVFTSINDVKVLRADIHSASRDFSGTAGTWAYRFWTGSGSTALTYSGASGSWVRAGTTADIGRYTMTPSAGTGEWVIRSWTAPKAGTIAIRGWIMKEIAGVDGIRYGMTKNGVWFTPQYFLSGSDVYGVSIAPADVTVAAGDRIEFVLNSGGAGNTTSDTVSWVPLIAYR